MAGLTPYTGAWTRQQAAHLLRRTLLGPKKEEITSAASAGLSGTLNQLFSTPTPWSPPLNHFSTRDPKVPVGATWVKAARDPDYDVGEYRYPSLRAWYWGNLLEHDFNIMARMTMFWVNHFGMGDVGEHRTE